MKQLPRGARVLRAIRGASGYSQVEMAAKLKMPLRRYQRIEQGTTRVLAEMLWEARAIALASTGLKSLPPLDAAIAEGRVTDRSVGSK